MGVCRICKIQRPVAAPDRPEGVCDDCASLNALVDCWYAETMDAGHFTAGDRELDTLKERLRRFIAIYKPPQAMTWG